MFSGTMTVYEEIEQQEVSDQSAAMQVDARVGFSQPFVWFGIFACRHHHAGAEFLLLHVVVTTLVVIDTQHH